MVGRPPPKNRATGAAGTGRGRHCESDISPATKHLSGKKFPPGVATERSVEGAAARVYFMCRQSVNWEFSTRERSDRLAGHETKHMDVERTTDAPHRRAWTIAECLVLAGIRSKTPRKRATLRAALLARARNEIADDATALDFICRQVAAGITVRDMAAAIAVDMGESCSRSFLSLIMHRLAPNATERIAAARAN